MTETAAQTGDLPARPDFADRLARNRLVVEGGRFDSAAHTGPALKMGKPGLAHHKDFVADGEMPEGAAHTDHAVARKGMTDLVAHMYFAVKGAAVSGSTAHIDSVARRRMAGLVVHIDLASWHFVGHIAREHWDYRSIGQSSAGCHSRYIDLAVGPEDYIDRL